ncbi:acetate/propionate family kinase [Patescibacteria group bacterium]|nr:acetate/propionate family kinase [Candidatus Falkowbacteria bacterium]MBU3905784.1 acetate/propionate family kinase [Patescibacteria group bacterium]MCG2698806.1 acetate/propionate family kinase [Candidatus Parcubacteria bacterium]MBU4015284.1 acetate/propionate family kinase [Patescibacteria group bacterium]MBU4026110.1 acetate/propionate family kinase [Patescibacteria group bacterium]
MSILVINSGSTSFKYKLFDDGDKEIKGNTFSEFTDLSQAVKSALKEINDLRDISAIGHRVVHGGDEFIKPEIIDDEKLAKLEKYNELAPLHNPYNSAGIKEMMDYFPDVPQVAVFDTAFFAALPDVARTYALPTDLAERLNIKRYGFHGISHEFVAQEAAHKFNKDINKINLISCHLGGGWSIAAVKNGKPIDISMGWTPLEGLVMMTRAGDLDPGVIIKLIKDQAENYGENALENVYKLLNYESGIKGVSGGVDNFKDLLKEINFGDEKAKLAFDLAVYRLRKYIGAYWAVLEGNIDAVVFTGSIGSGDPITRNNVMSKLKFLGNVPVLAIKTNEELMIARETRQLAG